MISTATNAHALPNPQQIYGTNFGGKLLAFVKQHPLLTVAIGLGVAALGYSLVKGD